jgi:deoxyribonuclease V
MPRTTTIDRAEVAFFEALQNLLQPASSSFIPELVKGKDLSRICGVDAAYLENQGRAVAVSALCVNGSLAETGIYCGRYTYPYVSGLFFLHEGPFAVAAVKKLTSKPELVCFDAQGIAHPRLKGLATICGMILGIPSIGISKSLLVGEILAYKEGLGKLRVRGREAGYVSGSQNKKRRRTFWSPGYAVTLEVLEEILSKYEHTCLEALTKAHQLSKEYVRKVVEEES